MARMPGAEWLPAGDGNSTMRMDRHDIVCIHTIVGYAPAKAAHFSTNGEGHIWQHRDTDFQSAANLNGNHRVIAIENEDFGPEFGGAWSSPRVPRFTAVQAESIAQVLVWAHRTHGIPLELCPDSRPGSRGIAYHRQGIDSSNNFAGFAYGGRVAGGEVWSASTGKICPGDARIKQLIEEIIPRARALAGGSTGVSAQDVADYMRSVVRRGPDGVNRNLEDTLFQAAVWAGNGNSAADRVDARTRAWANPDGSLRVSVTLTPEQLAQIGQGVTVNIDGGYKVTLTKESP